MLQGLLLFFVSLNGWSSSLKGFSLSTEVLTETNTYTPDSPDYAADTKYSATPTLIFKDGTSLSLKLSGLQSLAADSTATLDNSEISLNLAPIEIGVHLKWSKGISGVLPTNYLDKRNLSYQGSVSLESSLLHQVRPFSVPFSLVYSLAYIRNFHEFTRSATDEENLEHMAVLGLGVSKSFLQRFKIGLSGAFYAAETYQDVWLNYFNLSESITYIFDPKNGGSVSFGHYNKASTLRPNGRSSNVELFNKTSSTLYAAVGYTF